jgi:hypothetical protein
VLGKYLISDQPMSEEDWARERADVIDEQTNAAYQPRFGDGREEKHLDAIKRLEATPVLPSSEATSKKPNKINGSK